MMYELYIIGYFLWGGAILFNPRLFYNINAANCTLGEILTSQFASSISNVAISEGQEVPVEQDGLQHFGPGVNNGAG